MKVLRQTRAVTGVRLVMPGKLSPDSPPCWH